MYSQYQNSPKFTAILEKLRAYLTVDIADVYFNWYNLETANTEGLDNWGRILNQSRVITITEPFIRRFGFNPNPPHTITPTPTNYPLNFGFKVNNVETNSLWGNFAVTTTTDILTNADYRKLLKFIYLGYVTDRSITSILNTVNWYCQNQYPNTGRWCNIIETTKPNPQVRFNFNFLLDDIEIQLFKYNDLLPRPAGVKSIVTWNTPA